MVNLDDHLNGKIIKYLMQGKRSKTGSCRDSRINSDEQLASFSIQKSADRDKKYEAQGLLVHFEFS